MNNQLCKLKSTYSYLLKKQKGTCFCSSYQEFLGIFPSTHLRSPIEEDTLFGWLDLSKIISKDIFGCLFNVHNKIILSRPEQMCLMSLCFERYLFHYLVEVTLEI